MTARAESGFGEPAEPGADVPVLWPDLPTARALVPWLEAIDASRQYSNFGPLLRQLEAALAEGWRTAAGTPDVVCVSSCTAALELGMAALHLPAGSSALMPDFAFPATAHAALRNQLRPVFSDVDSQSWQLTPAIARAALEHMSIGLVVPVATFGCPVDAVAWQQFRSDTGVPVLIDAAAAYGNQAVGSDIPVAFSFHATKPFGLGEGGALVSRDSAFASVVRRSSNFGFENGVAAHHGTNAKMSEYAAAVGLAQLKRWPDIQARRALRWKSYRSALAQFGDIALQSGFEGAAIPANLVLRLPIPAELVARRLAARGIATRRWYCPALHRHAVFIACLRRGRDGTAAAPEVDRLSSFSLGIPWFNSIDDVQQDRVIAALGIAVSGSAAPKRQRDADADADA